MLSDFTSFSCPAVVPVLVGPLQVILTILPGILLAMLGGLVRLFSPSGFRNALRLAWQQKITVAVLALTVVGCVYGYRALMAHSRGDFSGSAEKGSDWTCARFDLLRTGAVPGSPSPTVFKSVWNYKSPEGFGFLSSPAIVGNRLYLTGAALGCEKIGQILCLDADTGAVVWANAPDGYRATFSSPVVSGDYLVCGEGLHETADARIICLDVHKGTVLWTVTTANHVECTPFIYEDRVYVGAGDDGIYCVDLKPGPDGKAKVNWHLTQDQVQDCETSLAVHDGKVYFGLGIGPQAQAMCVIDAGSGRELKRIPMDYPVFSPSTIDVANNQMYFGMGNGTYPELGEGGAVQCLKLDTLAAAWTFKLNRTVLGAVAVVDDLLYFGCGDGVLYCLTKDGELSVSYDTNSALKTSPAVTDKAVYVVTDNGMLIALERKTLERMWEYRLGADQYFYSSPAVARGHVYVGTAQNGFFCLGEAVPRPYWPNPLSGLNKTGNDDDSPVLRKLPLQWTYPPQADKQEKIRCPTSIAVWKDNLFVPITAGKKTGLACLPKEVEANDLKPRWFFETAGEISQAPVVLAEYVLATAKGATANDPGRLLCLQRDSGQPAWELPLAFDGVLTVLPAQPDPRDESRDRLQILIQDKQDHLTSLDRDGKVVWSRPVGALGKNPADPLSVNLYPTAASNIIVAATWALAADIDPKRRPALLALDRVAGSVLWAVPLSYAPHTSPFVSRNVIYLGTDTGIEARSLLDGTLTKWKCEAGPPSAEFAISEKWVFYVNRAGEMIIAHRADGTVKGREPGALPGFPPLPFKNDAVVVTEKGLAQAQFSAGEKGPLRLFGWAETEDLGPLAASVVLSSSRLFVPTVNRGLVCIGGKE
jgi:outer membrane protein assembly factor BamB